MLEGGDGTAHLTSVLMLHGDECTHAGRLEKGQICLLLGLQPHHTRHSSCISPVIAAAT